MTPNLIPQDLLLLVALAVIGLLCALVLWTALTRPSRLPTEACCAQCRYPVRGLEGHHCPECGADLHVVGITTPALEIRRRGSTAAAVVAWAIIGVIGGTILYNQAVAWGRAAASSARIGAPMVTTYHAVERLQTRASPRVPLTLAISHEGIQGEHPSMEIAIAAPGPTPGTEQTLTIHSDGTVVWKDPSGTELSNHDALTRDDLAAFLQSAAVPTAAAAPAADELLAAIQTAKRPTTTAAPAPSAYVSSFTSGAALIKLGHSTRLRTTPLPVDTTFYTITLPRLAAAAITLLWLTTLTLILLRRRHLQRQALLPTPATTPNPTDSSPPRLPRVP